MIFHFYYIINKILVVPVSCQSIDLYIEYLNNGCTNFLYMYVYRCQCGPQPHSINIFVMYNLFWKGKYFIFSKGNSTHKFYNISCICTTTVFFYNKFIYFSHSWRLCFYSFFFKRTFKNLERNYVTNKYGI